MATIAAKAARRAHVNTKLAEQSEQLATTFDIEIPPVPGSTRDPELDQIIQLERVAGIFDRILNGEAEQEPDGDAEPSEGIDLETLAKMPREELEKLAADLGIEAADDKKAFPNKGVLAEAVKAAFDANVDLEQAEQEPDGDAEPDGDEE